MKTEQRMNMGKSEQMMNMEIDWFEIPLYMLKRYIAG